MPTYLLELSRDDLSDTTPKWVSITAFFLEGEGTSTGVVGAGAGGTDTALPAFVRGTRVPT